jgi:hypothetical protein
MAVRATVWHFRPHNEASSSNDHGGPRDLVSKLCMCLILDMKLIIFGLWDRVISMLVVWVVTHCRLVRRQACHRFTEYGSSTFIRNIYIYLQEHAALQPRSPTSASSPPWEPQISHVVVEWLTLLLRIWEIPRLDSRPRWPSILIEVFVVFISPSRRMPGEYLKISSRPLPTKSFPIHHHSLILSPTPYSLVTEKASLNKLPTNPKLIQCTVLRLHTPNVVV